MVYAVVVTVGLVAEGVGSAGGEQAGVGMLRQGR